MRVHIVQTDIVWEDRGRNRETVAALLDTAALDHGDLVLLPEMFDTGFTMTPPDVVAATPAAVDFVTSAAKRLGVYVQAGHAMQRPGEPRPHNVMTVAGPDGTLLAQYAKNHLFSLGREHEAYTPGQGVVTWAWGESQLRVCPAICYDLRFPELFGDGLRVGAEVFALGACWPSARHAHWRALVVARAIENQAYVLAANRTGTDPTLTYEGGSMVVDPRGEIVGELGAAEGVLSVEIVPREVRAWREKFPAWKERK